MRVIVDMNLSPEWATLLAADSHDAVHWRDLGSEDVSDDEIISRAARDSDAILTADLGFAATIAVRRLTAPSVIQLRTGSKDPLDVGPRVLAAIRSAGDALLGGAILTVETDRIRLRAGPDLPTPTDIN